MELKIKVKTPKGQANVTSERIDIKTLLLFRTGAKLKETYVNEDNSEFIWLLDVPARNYLKVVRNVSMFSVGTHKVLSGVAGSKLIKKHMEEGYEEKLDAMFRDTKIEILKQATAEELAEIKDSQETYWERIKKKWKRKSAEQ